MSKTIPRNVDDIIDSRDVIARIEDLSDDLAASHEAECGEPRGDEFDDWLISQAEDISSTFNDEASELLALRELQKEAEAYAPDWNDGATLIADSYFETYAQTYAEDIGAIPSDASWPCTCIDWEKAAEELKQDYTSVDFDGHEYWIR